MKEEKETLKPSEQVEKPPWLRVTRGDEDSGLNAQRFTGRNFVKCRNTEWVRKHPSH